MPFVGFLELMSFEIPYIVYSVVARTQGQLSFQQGLSNAHGQNNVVVYDSVLHLKHSKAISDGQHNQG